MGLAHVLAFPVPVHSPKANDPSRATLTLALCTSSSVIAVIAPASEVAANARAPSAVRTDAIARSGAPARSNTTVHVSIEAGPSYSTRDRRVGYASTRSWTSTCRNICAGGRVLYRP